MLVVLSLLVIFGLTWYKRRICSADELSSIEFEVFSALVLFDRLKENKPREGMGIGEMDLSLPLCVAATEVDCC